MPMTITWGQGPAAWAWSLLTSLPSPVTDLLAPATMTAVLEAVKPFLPLAAEAVGATVLGVVLMLIATTATRYLLGPSGLFVQAPSSGPGPVLS